VRRVWNGSADPKYRQMRGAISHMFLNAKDKSLADIHRKIVGVYGEVMNRQNVTNWCCAVVP
jgi:hypothetical protein